MNTYILKQKGIVSILVSILMVTFGTQNISYAQEVTPTITASVEVPLTEENLHGSIVTLTLSGRSFASRRSIENALSFSGIQDVVETFEALNDIRWFVRRVSDTVVTVFIPFSGNIDADAILTITLEAGAIANYLGPAFTVQLPVTAAEEKLVASTQTPLTEATLSGGVVVLTLSGRTLVESEDDIERVLTISGIDGVTVRSFFGIDRVSDTVLTIELVYVGDIDTDATLTFTLGSTAITNYYNGRALTATLPVTAIEESLEASTEAPLTEATLNGSTITLTLSGHKFAREYDIEDALGIYGIQGIGLHWLGVERVSDTVATVPLTFSGNIDTDATFTLIVGADAVVGYNAAFFSELPVIAVEESLEASTAAPLTEATLNGSTITLTLSGRQFADQHPDYIDEDAVSVSGIEGVSVDRYGIRRVSDTEATVELTFSGNIDTDAMLAITVGADAINYDKPFTFQFPVAAVEESLEASTEAPLTEATLNGSTITLTLTGRHFADRWDVRSAVSVTGIEGVRTNVSRVSDTVATVGLRFGSDFDMDATLELTVGADAIVGYDKGFTFQLPVTAIQQSKATVSISPASVVSPNIGETLTFSLKIKGGENVAGYQATVLYSSTALDYDGSVSGDYLPEGSFFWAEGTKLAASTLTGASNGDGTLATLTFKVEDFKPSTLRLSKVYLVDTDGKRWEVTTESAQVTIPPEPENAILGDINRDGVVNIQDLIIVKVRFGETGENSADINGDHIVNIVDLVMVAGAIGNGAAAPALSPQSLKMLTAVNINLWLSQAQQLELTDATFLRGIRFLEQLLAALIPEENALLPNYPNPFNPETWIPYQLAKSADVTLYIYAVDGTLVRTLALGHQSAGMYQSRSRAAYWDGKNAFGESVASGVYFYTLMAGDFTATRKMLIRK